MSGPHVDGHAGLGCARRLPRRLRGLGRLGGWALASCWFVACSEVPVRLTPPRAPGEGEQVATWVGDLLEGDASSAATAERRLLALTETGRAALRAHARAIPTERDPRWLHVLDEVELLPALSAGERVALWLWKARRPERSFAMKAEARLVEAARGDLSALLAEVAEGGDDVALVAVALVVAQRRDAVPALLRRYLAAEQEEERRHLSDAVARLVGEEVRPRLGGTQEERARDATEALRSWGNVAFPAPEGMPRE